MKSAEYSINIIYYNKMHFIKYCFSNIAIRGTLYDKAVPCGPVIIQHG